MSDQKKAYTLPEASATTGLSVETLRRATRSGALLVRYPITGNGKPSTKGVILAADLDRWLEDAPTQAERSAS